MKEEIITVINPITENQISSIDEEKLPQIFTEQVRFLEKANQEYSKAEEKEQQARKKVETALKEADALIDAAKNVGSHTAKKKKFLWAEWTSNSDEIDALKENLKEIIDHSEDSAEAQKKLAEVQSSLMESQTAILQVQKAHMEYQRQIANATKFVFGLSAYNMATSQSVLIKLKAILSGASEEQLGELAQQQLFLALDQIKNQESIITRINENDDLIKKLNLEIEKKQKEIAEIGELDKEQDRRISANANALEEHERAISEQQKKDKEHEIKISENAQDIDNLEHQNEEQDKLLAEMVVADEKQDELIEQGIEKDKVQDKVLAEMAIADEKQDELIAEGIEKDKVQDKLLAEMAVADEQQDELIEQNRGKNEEQDKILTEMAVADEEQDELIEQNRSKNVEQDEILEKIIKLNEEQSKEIDALQKSVEALQMELATKGNKIFLIATSAASIGALIISILHFFI